MVNFNVLDKKEPQFLPRVIRVFDETVGQNQLIKGRESGGISPAIRALGAMFQS